MLIKFFLLIIFILNFYSKESISQVLDEANNLLSIVAIVNDEPITMMDLDARLRLIIVSSNLPNNLETRNNLSGQVLQSLISERLQHQEAKKLGIRVTDQEIQNNIRFIEQQNNMEENQLIETLFNSGVPKSALPIRLKSNLIMQKLLQNIIRPKVIINNNEVNNEYNNLLANDGKIEYQFSEISFKFSSLSKKEEIILIANQIRKKIIEEDNFDMIGKRIQENGTGTYKNNDWKLINKINKDIFLNINNLEKNEISELVITNTGVSIIKVVGKRQFKIPELSHTVTDIAFISFDLPINKNKTNLVVEDIRGITENLKTCDEMTEISKIHGNKRGKYLGKILLKNLPTYFIEELKSLNINQPSKPIIASDGIYVTMICKYNKKLNQEFAIKEMIKDNIRDRSTSILRERYLLDLNRKALIDVRI
ncbi:MAG: Chaperone SurA [Alphaproteobacteria bacterium MarineAlpha9_Bin3]|nr:MAG: Chaperone SurA [Alphaproteobacteria bacterium MarineAlpha9_Bin3]|tara:strand:- start:85 stop:1356 length:1272 start_codon:yes stop_codon:yes gene_type:complete